MPEPAKRGATYADLGSVPEHLVAEIIDGEVVAHPRPSPRHGATAFALRGALGAAFQKGRDSGGWIFSGGSEINLAAHFVVPDLAGWRRGRLPGYPGMNYFTIAPDWVGEILSESTERRDRTVKMRIYAEAEVPHLWLIDPRQQILEAFELVDGRWMKIGAWSSDDEVRAAPFDAITFLLADLWPLDRPLGLDENPQALYAGDR